MNKRGMLGNLIGTLVIIAISFMLYGTVKSEIDEFKMACNEINDTSASVTIFDKTVPSNVSNIHDGIDLTCDEFNLSLLSWVPFFFLVSIGLIMVIALTKMFRLISFGGDEFGMGGRGYSSSYDDDDDDDDEIEIKIQQRLKQIEKNKSKVVTTVEPEVTVSIKPEIKKESIPEKEDVGIDWGPGIDATPTTDKDLNEKEVK